MLHIGKIVDLVKKKIQKQIRFLQRKLSDVYFVKVKLLSLFLEKSLQ